MYAKRMCCVIDCKKTNMSHPDLSFFKLPSLAESDRRLKWLKLIDREDIMYDVNFTHQICEIHFEPQLITAKSDRKMLNRYSVPSRHLPRSAPRHRGSQAGPPAPRLAHRASQTNGPPATRGDHDDARRWEFYQMCDRFLPEHLAQEVQDFLRKESAPSRRPSERPTAARLTTPAHAQYINKNISNCNIQMLQRYLPK